MDIFSSYMAGLLSFSAGSQLSALVYAILIFAFFVHFAPKRLVHDGLKQRFLALPMSLQAIAYAGMILVFVGASIDAANFIYFRF